MKILRVSNYYYKSVDSHRLKNDSENFKYHEQGSVIGNTLTSTA